MNEKEWLECRDWRRMLEFLRKSLSESEKEDTL